VLLIFGRETGTVRVPIVEDVVKARPGARGPAAVVLMLAWAILLLAGWAVGSLVTNAHPAWDASAVSDLHGPARGGLTGVMRAFTWLGSGIVLNIVFFVALATLLLIRSWRNALFLTLASPGIVLMVQIIKPAVARTRPLGPHLTGAAGASWPSGHASSSAALYGGLLLVALSTRLAANRRARRILQLLVVTLLALIGFSRVYLGVHYPTDVVAAWLLVAAWLTMLERTIGHTPPGASGQRPLVAGAGADQREPARA
jgi:membrane-associated phospholipid phosphatase